MDEFLASKFATTWQDYLRNVFNVYGLTIKNKTETTVPSYLIINNDRPNLKHWVINCLCIDRNDFKATDDFKGLRNRPVFQVGETEFIFLNYNFLIDKIYQGLQFDFGSFLVDKGAIRDFAEFKSIYSQDFAEKNLFRPTLNFILEKTECIKLDSDQIKSKIHQSEPDYYVRISNHVMIFEFKDAIVNSDIKHSYDFDKILENLTTKMVANEKNKPKGVTQLINTINSIQSNGFEFDSFKARKAIIYPVIVFTDPFFNSFGINYILNKIFRDKLGNNHIGQVKDLILIDIDTLIEIQNEIRDRRINLIECFHYYYKHGIENKEPLDAVDSFSEIIERFAKEKSIKKTISEKFLQEIKEELFNE